ncbi:MAG TPA: FkbM family methyltransferase, partial [Solirubrobacteraceae bacterium]|nr:FkbM family methyltransferase [Solirubrobacteraceae bacterium]
QFRPVFGPVGRASTSWLRNRPRVVAHGQAAGMRIDPSGANAGYGLGTTEPLIQDAFAEQVESGGVVWDIGANIGFYSLIASRLVGDGEVIAFEPLPANVEAIRRNLELNGIANVRVLGVALGDSEGTADLQIHSQQTWAKLDTSADTAFQQELEIAGHVSVELSTIDRQLRKLPVPDLVKIDIEGAEVAALRGASELLSTHRPTIICEFHGTNEAVCDLLESHGYSLRTIETPEVPPRAAKWDVHVLATPGPRS